MIYWGDYMRIGFIKLVGYIGIYNGLGLKEIIIDFSKCKFKKIVIKADNGSGKSTLIKSLHVMPDNNGSLVPGMECRKEMSIINNDIVYNIRIIHPINSKGDRATTKAYLQKVTPEGVFELNPNGNISSYKDTIMEELSLDPNFITLSQLSGESRGLASLKPSDRKKFVTSLVSNTAFYNDMNKVFTKKSNIYKSMRNSIISKINNLGNKEKLISSLTNIDNRYKKLIDDRDKVNETISIQRTKISMLDKDNTIQDRFSEISNEVKNVINPKLQDNNNKLQMSLNKIGTNIDRHNIEVFNNNLILKQNELQTIIKVNESKINSMLLDREREAKQLQELNGKLKSLDDENMTKTALKNNIMQCNRNIEYYSKLIKEMRIKNINDISKEEFILALETLQDIKDMIFNIKDEYDYHILEASLQYINNNLQLRTNFDEIEELSERIEVLKYESLEWKELKSKISILDNRPTNCSIDTCPLIVEAIKASELNPVENYDKIIKEIDCLSQRRDNLIKEREENGLIIMCSKTITTLIRNIDRNTSIIRKLILDERFMNSSRVLDLISHTDLFNEVNQIYKYLDVANIIDSYKADINKLREYENQLTLIGEKENITNSILEQIKFLDERIKSIQDDMDRYTKEIIDAKNELSGIKSAILETQYIMELYSNIDSLSNRKQELMDEFQNIKESMKTIKECVTNIEILTNEYNNIVKELNPLSQDRDKLQYSLKMYDEYEKELEEYNKKYELIETLKRYSSPTTGIQTLFINMYMNKTLSLANEMLGLMFNGKYVLGQFVVNESEFRIPCMGSGLMNDDISSMSSAETCMIGMIISFAMLNQANTQYNILSLDEADGVLDTTNRIMFLEVLNKLLEILNVEQCFIISHNSELNLRDCDVIILKTNDMYNLECGNIIYNYNNI